MTELSRIDWIARHLREDVESHSCAEAATQ